ncbi:hypothetical protein FVE85_0049 [Porphyridium purpureum]|uniref:Uncharacterized protein n=1 Tax=Porphyridium purpureum TaxID=35688 RepID=A0A5J4YZA7_PORPP|nr:hypothetical protein FVE85_0049 [Porphyridium purpureum]|eukprot:POR0573..scf208_2
MDRAQGRTMSPSSGHTKDGLHQCRPKTMRCPLQARVHRCMHLFVHAHCMKYQMRLRFGKHCSGKSMIRMHGRTSDLQAPGMKQVLLRTCLLEDGPNPHGRLPRTKGLSGTKGLLATRDLGQRNVYTRIRLGTTVHPFHCAFVYTMFPPGMKGSICPPAHGLEPAG